MQKLRNKIFFLMTVLVVASLFYLLQSHEMDVSIDVRPTQAEAQKSTIPAVAVPIKFDGETLPRNLFIQISKAVNPTVVNISTTQKIRRSRNRYYFGGPGGGSGDPFQDFLEQSMGGQMQAPPEQQVSSLGTGFIIEPDGLIVTNNHVIAEASEIKVQVEEKSKKLYTAKVIGRDPRSDLALIKINPENPLPVAVLGNSDAVEVGEWVAAFGNPYGHGHTMTKGIISAKERDIPGEIGYFPFLQTDASINPGNSGGPLTNSAGEVISVNAAIDARAQGIGFAIPVNVLKKLLPQLKKGKVTRGYLGVAINDIDEKVQKQLRLKADKGALVLNVTPGSPADKAGVQNYDVITEIDGKPIKDSRELMIQVAEIAIGKSVKLKIMRDNKPVDVTVKITERPEDEQLAKNQGPTAPGMKAPFDLGITMSMLNEQLAEQFQIYEAPPSAVVITRVSEGSPAEAAGFVPGDIILDINRKRITTPQAAVKASRKGQNSVRVLRAEGTLLLFVDTNA